MDTYHITSEFASIKFCNGIRENILVLLFLLTKPYFAVFLLNYHLSFYFDNFS